MRSFKRWMFGAIVLVALASVACTSMAPKATGQIADMTFKHDAMKAMTVKDLGRFFSESQNATYSAKSNKVTVATVSVAGTTLTVTPIGAGEATVTVTASSGRETATQSFTVTVEEKPEDPAPTNIGEIPNMQFDAGAGADDAMTVQLGDYFKGADTYTPTSSKESVATALVSGAVLTVTPVGPGTANVTVKASNDSGFVSQAFSVTVADDELVEPPDNNQPRQTGMIPALTDLKFGGEETVNLSMYFTDDDDDEITYTAMSADTDVVTVGVAGSTVTVTVVAPGMTRIDVTATDPYNRSVRASFNATVTNQPPMVQADEPTKFGPFMIGVTQNVMLSRYFKDPEGESLTYTAMSDMTDYVTASDPGAGETTTITAVAAGKAMITITANDGTNDAVSHTLTVTVSATPPPPNQPPAVVSQIADQSLELDFNLTETIDVKDNFDDPDDGPSALTYTPSSSMPGNVTTTVEGSMITINAVAKGSATITVTASDGAATIDAMFNVTVRAPAVPTLKEAFANVTFEHDGPLQTFTLEDHFNRATGYHTDDGDGTVVMAAVNDEGTMLTLTRVGEGSAAVRITPYNSGGDGTTQVINVTVKGAPRGPVLQKDMKFVDITRTVIADVTEAATADTAEDDVHLADFDLTMYFEDPDGLALKFSTMTSDETTVAVYDAEQDFDSTTGIVDGPKLKADLDKAKMTDAAMVELRARKEGTAMITVVATDVEGLPLKRMFTVTVIAWTNEAPASDATNDLPADLTNLGTSAGRLKSTAMDAKTVKVDLAEHFTDANVANTSQTDSLKFSAKSSDEKVATVRLVPTGSTSIPQEHNVIVTPVGSGTATITLNAEDSFALMNTGVAKTFMVRVNHRPMAQGGQEEEPKMLVNAEETRSMVVSTTAVPVRLVDDSATADVVEGYFTDKDETDSLLCRFGGLSDDKVAGVAWSADGDRTVLAVTAKAEGKATVQVWCYDQVDVDGEGADDFEMSDKATLTINVTASGSIH